MGRRSVQGPETTEVMADLTSVVSRLSKVIALAAVRGLQQKQQVELFSHAGFTNIEIAEMVGTTPHTVVQTLHELRKERKTKKAAAKQVKPSP